MTESNNHNVWLWLVTEKNCQTLLKKNLWASWNNHKIRKLIKFGDKVVFYVKGTLQIQGIFTFSSDWYDSKKPIWDDEVNEIKYPLQIKIKPIKTGTVDIRKLIPKLRLFQSVPLSKSGKLERAHSLILKPGSRGFPSNSTKPLFMNV